MADPTENDMMKAMVLDAMMKSLDQKKRDELIRLALEALIRPTSTGYGYGAKESSALQDAFDLAITSMARDVVKDLLGTMEVKDRIRSICVKAFEKMTLNEDRIAIEMASVISRAMVEK